MTLIWLGMIIILILLEFTTKRLVTIWYVLSALISLILSIFIDSFFIQFLVFVILGTIILVTFRDYFINLIKDNKYFVKLKTKLIVKEKNDKKGKKKK